MKRTAFTRPSNGETLVRIRARTSLCSGNHTTRKQTRWLENETHVSNDGDALVRDMGPNVDCVLQEVCVLQARSQQYSFCEMGCFYVHRTLCTRNTLP